MSVLDDVARQVRHAARNLRRCPGYAAGVVISLALGMGLNTAVFAVVNATLRQSLPYGDAAHLVAIGRVVRGGPAGGGATPTAWESYEEDVAAWQSASSLSSVAVFAPDYRVVAGHAGAEYVKGATASLNLLPVLGVRLRRGRWFAPDEAAARVVVISQRMADRQFAGAAAVGSVLTIQGESWTVIGIMPAGLGLPTDADYWLPSASQSGQVIGRVKDGYTLAQVATELTHVSPTIHNLRRAKYSAEVLTAPLHERLFGSARPALLLLFASSVLLLLIASANIANLSLARTLERRREMAVRLMLGASRWSLAGLIVTENLLLAVWGGALGLLLSMWCIGLILALGPQEIVGALHVGASTGVSLFAASTAIIVGLAISIGPLVAISDGALHSHGGTLGGLGARSGRSRASRRIRQTLVAAQIALALLLMTGTGLLLRSMARLTQVDHLGFSSKGVIIASVQLTGSRYRDSVARAQFVRELAARAKAIPNVVSVGLGPAPLVAGVGEGVREGFSATYSYRDTTRAGGPATTIWVKHVDVDYLTTYGIRLRAGRPFSSNDNAGSPPVVIVNRAAATLLFHGRDAVGATVAPPGAIRPGQAALRVVGIVDDVLQRDPTLDATPEILIPIAQQPTLAPVQTIAVRTSVAPGPVVAAVREALRSIDPELAATRLQPMDAVVSASLARQRFILTLLAVFAMLAAVLAVVGLYAVISYLATQRTVEISIRLALGAQRGHVLGLVLQEGIVLTGIGLSIGVLSALAFGRYVASFVYGITPHDALTFALTAGVLGAVAVTASVIPARRAARLDPAATLRNV